MISALITGVTAEERLKKANILRGTRDTKHGARNPNLYLFDFPTAIGIDEIRGLQKNLSLKSFDGKLKTAIINNAQNLTIEAQNALLKTLEEPPKNSQIILTAPNAESLLPTIISRCQIVELPHKSQISLTKKEFTSHFDFLVTVLNASIGKRLQKIEELNPAKDRLKAIEWIEIQIITARQALIDNLVLPKSRSEKTPAPRQLLAVIKSLQQARRYLQANVNVRLTLDNLVLGWP